jgi:RNA polymerase sigma-70 factor (ECF subfamily)
MGERDAMSSRCEAAPSGDEELSRAVLEGCRARDPDAFRSFVKRYERMVFAVVSRIAGVGPHVEDLAQEAFLRAFRAFPTFELDGPARPSTWLITIAARLALNARRQTSQKAAAVPIAYAAAVRDGATPETERARRELGRAIARAADDLPVDQRAAFVLAEFHGLSIAEIATVLETPEPTIKTRLFRARAHLRERLAEFQKDRGDDR